MSDANKDAKELERYKKRRAENTRFGKALAEYFYFECLKRLNRERKKK